MFRRYEFRMEVVSYARGAPASRVSPRLASDDPRVPWVDAAKGICIILVVMMHSTLGVGDKMGGEGFMHSVVAFARPFRMPDFFLVSGLFLGRVIDRDWRRYGDKRVLHFVYFYLLWLAIQSGLKYGETSDGSPATFLRNVAYQLVQPGLTLWFIYMLAIFSVVTKLLRRVPAMPLLAFAAALEILPVETHLVLVDEFCDRWVYFLAGYLLAARVFQLAAWASRHRGPALGVLAVWAAINGELAFLPSPVPHLATLAELPAVSLVLGAAGALAIVTLASVLVRSPLAGALGYCGRNSIAIYLAFFLPMALARTAIVKTGLVTDIGWASLIVTAVGVLVPLGIERAARDTHLSFLFRRPAWCRVPTVREPSPAAQLPVRMARIFDTAASTFMPSSARPRSAEARVGSPFDPVSSLK